MSGTYLITISQLYQDGFGRKHTYAYDSKTYTYGKSVVFCHILYCEKTSSLASCLSKS